MGAYLSLAALVIQFVFLAIVLSVVGVYANRFIQNHLASRQGSMKRVKSVASHADAARARAQARSHARLSA